VDLVKMDIEGAEYHVLTDPILDLSKVENLIVEVHYDYRSRESREIIDALTRKGFKIVPLYPDRTPKSYHLLACRSKVAW
jgi:predicted CoA-binding protein